MNLKSYESMIIKQHMEDLKEMIPDDDYEQANYLLDSLFSLWLTVGIREGKRLAKDKINELLDDGTGDMIISIDEQTQP